MQPETIHIGIDPGKDGAVAFLFEDGAEVFDFEDGEALIRLRAHAAARADGLVLVHAFIEKVSAMPKQGVSSTFKFGANFGQWVGRLEALGVPFDFVTPQKWKRAVFDSMPKGDAKAMALDRARRMFPELGDRLKRKRDHGRAEALLIAAYARKAGR